ncbi:MAG: gliding motility-associated C-terminal domain-containing protein [Saprospiraceae bacterium]
MTLHFTATAQFKISGDASQTSAQCFELTPDQQFKQGSVISRQKLDVQQDFTIAVTMNFGRQNFTTSGADGIAFIMMTDTFIPVTGNGGGIGYEGTPESLVVEFDTYQNDPNNDPAADHVALIIGGNPVHGPSTLAGPNSIGAGGNVEDTNDHDVVFSWKAATQEFTVYFDCAKVLGYVGPISGPFFGGKKEVFWGFTSSTGSARNKQSFCFKNNSSWVDVLKDETYCDSSLVTLNGGAGAISYKWTPSNGLSNPFIAKPTVFVKENTTFLLEKLDACGNATFDSMRVFIVPNTIALELGADTSLCEGQDLTLKVQQTGADYTWSTGAKTQSINVNTSGIYSVIVDDGNCKKNDQIEISSLPLPVINVSADTIICNNSKAILTAVASVDDITWSNGDTGPSIIVEDEGTYTASVVNQCGISEDEVTVSLKNCDDYFVPNIFSPNYDGINDYFGPTRSEAIQNIERLAIYNRWGALVFEALNISADDEEKMWDGTFRGQEANPDTYVYLIKLKLVSGKVVVVKGSVNLVR